MQALTWAAPGPAEVGWLLGVAATLGLALMVMGAVRMLRLGRTEAASEPASFAADPVVTSATSPDGSRVRVLVVPMDEIHQKRGGEQDGVRDGVAIRRVDACAAEIVLPVEPHPPR